MYILAFETSCDDTSVAVMRDDICIALSTRTQLEHDAIVLGSPHHSLLDWLQQRLLHYL